jgi:hypothetical protein
VSRDSSVGIATGYELNGLDSIPGKGKILFSLSTEFTPALDLIQPPIQWLSGVKRLGPEAEYSPPSSAEVKNGGAIPPLSHVSS